MRKLYLLPLVVCLLCSKLSAQNFSNGFPFLMPPFDSTAQKFLPHFPPKSITEADRVTWSNDGNFKVAGKNYRFWGVNITAAGAFPDKSLARQIAARMRKMGINLVRLHHLENDWSGVNGSIFNYASGTTRTLNAAALDKLEYFIAQLKAEGIYVNMNLHVSRDFQVADGIAGADSLVDFGKPITMIDPHVQFLQREYATQLLGRINPYTNTRLADDPVMAMLETNNETSLIGYWKEDRLKKTSEGGALLARHVKRLDSLFQKFLQQKYITQAALATAWNTGGTPTGTGEQIADGSVEVATMPSAFQLELHNGAAATITLDNSTAHSGAKSILLNTTNYTGTGWHIQFKRTGLSVVKDKSYYVSFWAKASSNTTLTASLMRDNAPYTWYNGQNFNLSTTWQKFSFIVTAPEDNAGFVRLAFNPSQNGSVWFDEISMADVPIIGLMAGEDLSAQNIQRIAWPQRAIYTNTRVADMAEFYTKIQKEHFDIIKSFLKTTLGVKAPITGTNALVGPSEVYSMDNMDYLDDHSYWDHPSFPGVAWSATDWQISNQPQVKSTGLDAITNIVGGLQRADRPYTISEYNQPAPNIYRTEMVAPLAAYSAFHGIDGIMFFEYNGEFTWANDVRNNFFGIHRDNSIMALFPSVAKAYRDGLMAETTQPIVLNFSAEASYKQAQTDNEGRWGKYIPWDKKIGLSRSVRIGAMPETGTLNLAAVNSAGMATTTDNNETTWNQTKGVYFTQTNGFNAISGFLDQATNQTVGTMTLKAADGFGALTWLSLEANKALTQSKLSLLTLSTSQQNTNGVWNGTTTLNNNWGTSPTLQRRVNITLELKIEADSIKLYQLNAEGKEGVFQTIAPVSANTFVINLDQNTAPTLWWGIEAIRDECRPVCIPVQMQRIKD
jgi:hypothetical protein